MITIKEETEKLQEIIQKLQHLKMEIERLSNTYNQLDLQRLKLLARIELLGELGDIEGKNGDSPD